MVLGVYDLAKHFDISPNTVRALCRTKGSPAFKAGITEKSSWKCDTDKFERFLVELAERSKG